MSFRTACPLLILCLILFFAHSAQAQPTSFTYQGSLQNGGSPANGNYDFEFALFSAVSVGSQLGTTQTVNGVVVANGVFSVTLNFGDQFPGNNRFLEIRVRTAGGGAFTTLSPRQSIQSAPYSVKSVNATNATTATTATTANNALQLGGVSASEYIVNGETIINAGTQFNIAGSRVLSVSSVENTFAGLNAGLATDPASIGNSFFGFDAGRNTTIGGANSFFGSRAGRLNTGSANSIFGYQAGQSNTSGLGNSFFGSEAGTATNTGGSNSFFGAGAGISNTSASSNSFFGRVAGRDNTTGTRNSFFGHFAGLLNQTGSDNTFFGYEAGRASNTNNNSFFGFQAGRLATGINNSFFGWSSGIATTTGVNNSFFGVQSGLNNETGIRNVFIGRDAGRENIAGSENTFVGFNAGLNSNGSSNTAIGAGASVGTNLSFATAIGAGATVTSNNTIRIGRSTDSVSMNHVSASSLSAGSISTDDIDAGSHLSIVGVDDDGYIVEIVNYGGLSRPNADGLLIMIGSSTNNPPREGNNFIAFKTGDTVFGPQIDAGVIQGNNSGGVSYVTSGADYAEYLPRINKAEKIQSGDIVSVVNGRIAKDTRGSARSMVVSSGAAVVGNYPGEKEVELYEKVAFIGQAPVRVKGPVNAGDFIIASGMNDGTGIAVSPDEITPEQFEKVVGQAWESSNKAEVKLIRTAVGLIQRDPTVGRLIVANRNQAKRLASLEARLTEMEAKLDRQKPNSRAVASRSLASTKKGK